MVSNAYLLIDRLGMVFGYDVPVTFIAEGNLKGASIHVSGYFQPGPDDDEDDEDDDEDDEDGEGMDEAMYKKLLAENGGGDDDKLEVDDDSEDDDEDDDEEEGVNEAFIAVCICLYTHINCNDFYLLTTVQHMTTSTV